MSQQTQMDLNEPTSSAADSPALTFPWRESVQVWMEHKVLYGMSLPGLSKIPGQLGSWSRTSLASSLRTKVKTSPSSSTVLPNAGSVWRGAYWIAAISESPNDGVECSLSDVLEDNVPSKFYLSPRAAAGILRRAEKRGYTLPEPLMAALVEVTQDIKSNPKSSQHSTHQPERDFSSPTLRATSSTAGKTPSPGCSPLTALGTVSQSSPETPHTHSVPTDGAAATPTATKGTSSPTRSEPAMDPRVGAIGETEAITSWSVRRLTPTECERLQGFPEGWTLLPMDPDTPPSETQ